MSFLLDLLFGKVEDSQPLNVVDAYITNLKDIPYKGADGCGNDAHLDSMACKTKMDDRPVGKQVK